MRKSKKNSNRRTRRKTINKQRNKKSKKYYGGYVISVRDFFEDPWKYHSFSHSTGQQSMPGPYHGPWLVIRSGVKYKNIIDGRTDATYSTWIPPDNTNQHLYYTIDMVNRAALETSPDVWFTITGKTFDTNPVIYRHMNKPLKDNELRLTTAILHAESPPIFGKDGIAFKIDDSKMYIETPIEYDPQHTKLKREILEETQRMLSDKSGIEKERVLSGLQQQIDTAYAGVDKSNEVLYKVKAKIKR